jgi:hypothetical protein
MPCQTVPRKSFEAGIHPWSVPSGHEKSRAGLNMAVESPEGGDAKAEASLC